MQCSPAYAADLAKLVEYLSEEQLVYESVSSAPREALGEVFKYLFLLRSYPTRALSPSREVESAWEALLLFPLLYIDVCSKLPGGEVVDHDPTVGSFQASKQRPKTTTHPPTLNPELPTSTHRTLRGVLREHAGPVQGALWRAPEGFLAAEGCRGGPGGR